MQIFSSFNRASWCVHISVPSCLFHWETSVLFKSKFTVLSPHPCYVFVAPIARTDTWGPCIVDSFPHYLGAYSTAVVLLRSQCFAYMISWDWIVFLRKLPVWLWTALLWRCWQQADQVGILGHGLGAMPCCVSLYLLSAYHCISDVTARILPFF